MNVRIIAGEFGGRLIKTPGSNKTHPMGERVRGPLFNIIGDEIIGAKVLDVFAGAGSLGIEAISRGASSATFVDRDKTAVETLNDNIKLLGIGDKTKVVKIGASTWIDKNQDNFFDIIFVDPPFNDLQLSTVVRLFSLLKTNGLMVLSYPGRSELPAVDGIVVVDNRSYGNAALTFYRKENK